MESPNFISKISERKAKVCIIGLGYVGLPLAIEFARAGYGVIGLDLSEEKVEKINKGESYILDVPEGVIKPLATSGRITATTNYEILAEVDAVSICVPTPLSKTRDPDISFVVDAAEGIAKYLHNDQLVILESTTYPGTTEEVILPILENTGLKVGEDFFLAFSPERIDPGNTQYQAYNIPKVVGGITEQCTQAASALYNQVLQNVISVSSARVAEMTKLLENTFRIVNIGMVNEMALLCHRLGINVWEVIDAASTKPFGFMPFYPGPGLGGHCIPVDPFYLSWKARESGFEARFIELAGRINGTMPEFVVYRISDALNEKQKSINGSKILVVGVSYKKDVPDTRQSPALDIIEALIEKGAEVSFSDPYVSHINLGGKSLESMGLDAEYLASIDCCAIVTNHTKVNYSSIVQNSDLVFDCRNVLKGFKAANIVTL
ncbi:nucleotide sugar dehydrogenase [Candidatus Poribacteria bacterium]|nr:nucleotide sugar dehydrogenase [Candidatus Poribacteria bacterium]